MTPVAFHIGSLEIYWYGICMAVAFVLGYGVATRLAPQRGVSPDAIGSLLTWAILGGIVGARALYVVQNPGHYADNPLAALNVREGGLVFYGGFVFAALAVAWRVRTRHLAPWSVADIFAVTVPLGHAVGRIGCFLHGCCHGRVYDGCCAVHYAIPDESYFPIQLVASAGNACIGILLLLLFRRKGFRGRLFPLYVMLYSLFRFANEFGRGDYESRPGGLTPAQWICLVILPVGIVLWRCSGKCQRPAIEDRESA